MFFYTDINSGRLERSFVRWNGQDIPLGCSLFHISYDLRKLCPVQFIGRYSCWRFRIRGLYYLISCNFWKKNSFSGSWFEFLFLQPLLQQPIIRHSCWFVGYDFFKCIKIFCVISGKYFVFNGSCVQIQKIVCPIVSYFVAISLVSLLVPL